MVQVNIQINQKQSKLFARAIYTDIAAYIEAHQEEYQKFLNEREDKENDEVESAH